MSDSLVSASEGLSALAAIADEQLDHPIDSLDEKKQPQTHKRARPKHYHSLSNVDRERIVALYLNGNTVAKIASSLNIPPTTIYSILNTLTKENRITKKQKGGSKKHYREEDRKALAEIQNANHDITYRELREKWKDSTGHYEKKLSNGTINKILKEEKITTKNLYHIPHERNTPENIEKRKEYCIWAASLEQSDVVFLDETGFNLQTHRRRGRSKIGTRAVIERPGSRGNNISVCVALSATRGIIKWHARIGAFNGEHYAKFISELLQQPAFQLRTHYIIQDNVSFHKTETVKNCFTGQRIQHYQKFVPPYSPQLNMIEECFSKIHRYVDSKQKDDRFELLQLIEEACNSVTAADADGWYRQLFVNANSIN